MDESTSLGEPSRWLYQLIESSGARCQRWHVSTASLIIGAAAAAVTQSDVLIAEARSWRTGAMSDNGDCSGLRCQARILARIN